jgi:hypothetical protein
MDLSLANGNIVNFPFKADLFGAMRTSLSHLTLGGLAVASFLRHSRARTDKFSDGEEER